MRHSSWKHLIFAAVGLGLACVALLWSWNVLADLFNGPEVELRHVIAALVLGAAIKAVFTTRTRQW